MTKSELIARLSERLAERNSQLVYKDAELAVKTILDAMAGSLAEGQRIEIRGFGSFEIRHYKAYEGRNPRTGDPVGVQPKRLPFFKVGKELKERVNEAAQKQKEMKEQAPPTPMSASG